MLHKVISKCEENKALEHYWVMQAIQKDFQTDFMITCAGIFAGKGDGFLNSKELDHEPTPEEITQFLSDSKADFVSVVQNYRFENELPFCYGKEIEGMDKFTTIHGCPIKCIDCKENEDCYDSMDCDYIYNAIKKLSYYENLERHGLLPCMQVLVGKKCYKIVGNGIDKPRIEEDVVKNFQIKINDNYSAGLSIFLSKDEAEKALKVISKRITFVDAIKRTMVQLENETLRNKNNLTRSYALQYAMEVLKNEMKKAGFDSWG